MALVCVQVETGGVVEWCSPAAPAAAAGTERDTGWWRCRGGGVAVTGSSQLQSVGVCLDWASSCAKCRCLLCLTQP